ncbi:hypothetical protein GJ654_19030 [Rhodoblastus acidophilus]|uniref:Uncharacterized protein n=1 Tax=Rhodoblastus acidophilus TaxID=1074 RepID=A0A6N8DRJ7_RHOAC|nr:hypothetical protein [Rhodoblastus acidophilus]MCW2274761.1 hypothetical protein [Rhodoblastus acidophilus]MTV33079.1 hypothetical protein [Rhodoblastus acidophilus]
MPVLVKTTLDGRKLEVFDQGLTLGGKLEARDLIAVAEHPNRAKILEAAPDAVYMAGRVPLNAAEAEIAQKALDEAEARHLTDPKLIEERFRRLMWKRARDPGLD